VDIHTSGADSNHYALGSVSVDGYIDGTITTDGADNRIGSIAVNSAFNTWQLYSDGEVGALTVHGDYVFHDPTQVSVKAHHFGKITIDGNLKASIQATDANVLGISLGKLTAKSAGGSTIDASARNIATIEVGDWSGGGRSKRGPSPTHDQRRRHCEFTPASSTRISPSPRSPVRRDEEGRARHGKDQWRVAD